MTISSSPTTFRRSLLVCDDAVIKTHDPSLMRVEVAKARSGWAIGQSSGLFRAPRVLEYDDSRGLARFERLRGLQPIRNLFAQSGSCLPLFERVGRCLAVIHAELVLPDEMKVPLPEVIPLGQQDQVFLHGDLTMKNVLVQPDGGIVILDWQMTARYGELATWGTRYFDVGWFLNCLFVEQSYAPLSLSFHWQVERHAKAFLNGYCAAAEGLCNISAFYEFMRRFNTCNEKRRSGELSVLRRLLLVPSCVHLRRFTRSLTSQRGQRTEARDALARS